MQIVWTILLGLLAVLWILAVSDLTRGIASMPSLSDIAPLDGSRCPRISVLFAARNEAEKLPAALATMLALDYPSYEVIAVDDRSQDGTGAILQSASGRDGRLVTLRVDRLPRGWLGKPHALQQAYEHASGEWLVFTDADVHFAPDVLRRAMALAEQRRCEHLTLMCGMKLFTPGEKIAVTFFGMAFLLFTRPWNARNPQSASYMGVGAFQLIRRSAYEKLGTHRRLAMEVVDDMKLGKLAKEAGVASVVAQAVGALSVHWHAGLANTIRGTTKNLFASAGYRLRTAIAQMFMLLAMFVLPVLSLAFVHGWVHALAAVAVTAPLGIAVGETMVIKISPLYALTYPLGALIFTWMVARSTIVTLWQGGIVWRGTFYPLEELKRGVV